MVSGFNVYNADETLNKKGRVDCSVIGQLNIGGHVLTNRMLIANYDFEVYEENVLYGDASATRCNEVAPKPWELMVHSYFSYPLMPSLW